MIRGWMIRGFIRGPITRSLDHFPGGATTSEHNVTKTVS